MLKEITKEAILLVSFGTSSNAARQNAIEATAATVAAHYPDIPLYQAYSSSIVRGILAERGLVRLSVEEALKNLAAEGFAKVIVQPTHLLPGMEFEKVRRNVMEHAALFKEVYLGEPLLSSETDFVKFINIIADVYPLAPRQALVLLGHGSPLFANTLYAALDYRFKDQGHPHIYVGTVENYPGIEQVIAFLRQGDYKHIILAPLLLVAGCVWAILQVPALP